MKYKSKEEMKEHVEALGIAALSKFSSISYLSKLKIPLEAMIAIESLIREIECSCWTIIPLGIGDDKETFDKQIIHLKKITDTLIEAAKAMEFVKENI